MLRKDSTSDDSNFWISYADLMAGLLFVFILLIGAIVSKSIILKGSLNEQENKLTHLSKMLHAKELILKNTKKRINFKDDEISKLTKILLANNTQQDMLSKKIVLLQNIFKENNEKINNKKMKLEKKLIEYEGRIIILSDELTDVNNIVEDKDLALLKLLTALDDRETKYDNIVMKLQSQKAKIKSLTGIKLKVVAALKDALGDKVNIDKKSGSLRVSSNVLFDKGSSVLKENAKVELKQVFEEYIGALITNPNIKSHLDKIIVEGHTDSDGGYLYNLNLSQKRAFAVMNYFLTLDVAKNNNIKSLMTASGRSFLDTIKVNGVENKNASRRIEVNFRLKNEDAMNEIEKVLDAE